MGKYEFIVASTAFILLLNLTITSFPGEINSVTGLDTSSLQSSTNVSATVQANQTDETNVVDQAGSIVQVYTNPSTSNRILGGVFTLYLVALIVLLIDIIWVG